MYKIIYLFWALLALPLQAQTTDYTYKVQNTPTGWGGTGTYVAGDMECVEYYTLDHFYHGTFKQKLSGLPVGVYEAEVYFNSSCAAWQCSEICGNGTTGRTHLFFNDVEVDVPIYNVKSITSPTLYTLRNIHVTDGVLYMGARNDREGANWHIISLKSLRYVGTDARSLYDAQFPLIRKARKALDASTCEVFQENLRKAINESMVVSVYDPVDRLQSLYDNISAAIKESESFEKLKASALKNLLSSLDTFQRVWNNGGRTVSEAQWKYLLPFVAEACIAKDSECDYEVMKDARLSLIDAMTQTTAVTTSPMLPSTDPSSTLPAYRIDGRRLQGAGQTNGLIIEGGVKRLHLPVSR